jgi:hypothetical protein
MDQVVVIYSSGNRESTNPETPYHASFKIKTAAMSIIGKMQDATESIPKI